MEVATAIVRYCALPAALAALCACGGNAIEPAGSGDSGTSYSTPAWFIDSLEALAIARNAVPEMEPARLLYLRSDGGGVDVTGRGPEWLLMLADGASNLASVSVSPEAVTVDLLDEPGSCSLTDSITVLSSEVLVADARPRAEAVAQFKSTPVLVMWQELPCKDGEGVGGNAVSFFEPQGLAPPRVWDVLYDNAGVFLKVCGPCKKSGDSSCSPCYP